MNRMKILIGYDGSECSEAALDELRRAGLPGEAEAIILSVAEYWVFPMSLPDAPPTGFLDPFEGLLEDSEAFARQAAERVQSYFPSWDLRAEAKVGSPASVLLERAEEWKPDLIVVGSHGRSAPGRFLLGSISQRLATEAQCSVRIGRGHTLEGIRPIRVLIGVDGSAGSKEAVRAVASRPWPAGSEARLITLGGVFYDVIGTEARNATDRAREMHKKLEADLSETGLNVSSIVAAGDPRQEIVEEAHSWGADSIFVGARGLSRMKRFFLGSVSAAVAARAHCSVEIVRAKQTALFAGRV
ncbi:MAG TPA: universal stress protein [Blastocatellia bacterium]|nr:universal stress protein [Blastocatellia bacterium]